jgi:hypothetical protein
MYTEAIRNRIDMNTATTISHADAARPDLFDASMLISGAGAGAGADTLVAVVAAVALGVLVTADAPLVVAAVFLRLVVLDGTDVAVVTAVGAGVVAATGVVVVAAGVVAAGDEAAVVETTVAVVAAAVVDVVVDATGATDAANDRTKLTDRVVNTTPIHRPAAVVVAATPAAVVVWLNAYDARLSMRRIICCV